MTSTIPQSPVEQDVDNRIINPGSIQINVTGAFIVDEELYEDEESIPETNDIVLPYQNTENISHIAIDIGGSLAKIVYFTSNQSVNNSTEDLGPLINKKINCINGNGNNGNNNGNGNSNNNGYGINGNVRNDSISSDDSNDEILDPNRGGILNFYKIETEKIDEFIQFIAKLIKFYNKKVHIMATGGGSFKFYDRLRDELNVQVSKEDEMECLIVGLDFLITEIPDEVFLYTEQNPMQFVNHTKKDIYPYLLVNIGSGVSMVKVTGPNHDDFIRVGGSSLGGGTLWGLLSLITNANSYDEMLSSAAQGDNTSVDMLVGDIYGTEYNKIGLKSSAIASSFGKVFKKKHSKSTKTNKSTFKNEDISRSLLYAISNNIGQIAYLQAKIHDIQHIYFGGSYIRGHPQTMNTLSYAINFWSQGNKKAYFLRHEGYLGALGAFIKRQPEGWGRKNSIKLDELNLSKIRETLHQENINEQSACE
ncbi:Pantothenate kinase 1 [Wickerhamomyces ciferrii]|uniref:Pantothenate kinase 1 n=1 Tax=Wickerhamomyces ciferrii (strain ATCC 14091 / BCRC 22168 / CBS 111 / JCM 3599 / NBRC 0793 / NRRL Y-1031 F-60-10) TaxID=1206466 RepID=K0KTQ6_WICCF|nr:Pantothenate kinase 1 [Wickerhamomyces ciferrii]CCH45407.1 Pantothenate kinase 1 [Wickerhamomyces ciferrii]